MMLCWCHAVMCLLAALAWHLSCCQPATNCAQTCSASTNFNDSTLAFAGLRDLHCAHEGAPQHS
jgi:hypothetical protein